MRPKCKVCGTRENLQRHHESYDPEIVVYLCNIHHGEAHNKESIGRILGDNNIVKLQHIDHIDISFIYLPTSFTRKHNWKKGDNIKIDIKDDTLILKKIKIKNKIHRLIYNKKSKYFSINLPIDIINNLNIKKGDYLDITEKYGEIILKPL